ncbi:MAG: dTDP-4-dehydrorhamnose 3,5-epimerase [Rhodocyclaceae bacterium]
MKVIPTAIPDLLILEPEVFGDARGFFLETYNRRTLRDAAGIDAVFVQDNHSRSAKGVLRGLHYQLRHPQGKLVRASRGAVYDVAVDVRRSSASFGRAVGVELSDENKRMLWIPPGFAHGFLVLSETVDFFYKTTDFYSPGDERCIRWDDPGLAIPWPLAGAPLVSAKDAAGVPFGEAEVYP